MKRFEEYPKVMKHPQHAPAQYRQLEGKGKGLFAPDTVCTQAERFPDVTVHTRPDEERYFAKGYRPANNPDPVEYERVMTGVSPDLAPGFQQYPKFKYHPVELPVIVKTKEEEAALGPEWSDRPIIATEDDVKVSSAAPSIAPKPDAAGSAPDAAEVQTAQRTKPAAKKKSAQKPAKVDRRSKAYRDAQKNAAAT